MTDNYYALIMAGGGGTRLWPLSRRNRPKQSLALIGSESMFRQTVTRISPLFPLERIFVVTGKNHVDELRQDVPELPEENFLIEPFGRDSGPAAGMGTACITARDPEAVIAVLTADHHIADTDGFLNALRAAYHVAENDGHIVTLGITPDHPSTGFGYIKRGAFVRDAKGLKVYKSAGFREKPNQETAIEFVSSGDFSWNSGMFIWKAQQALGEFARQQPDIFNGLEAIRATYQTSEFRPTLESLWPEMEKISVDYAIMEKALNVNVIPVEIGWSDIGSWSSLYELLLDAGVDTDARKNVAYGENCRHIALDSYGTLALSRKVVVTIGLTDMVIVDTDDVLLICPRDRSQEVRAAVNQLRKEGHDELL